MIAVAPLEQRESGVINQMFDRSAIPVLEQVVNFSQARHGVLAGNIANLDTPGYKTRDLSPEKFQESLRQAVDGRHARSSASRSAMLQGAELTVAGPPRADLDDFSGVRESIRSIEYHDRSDISLEQQIAEITKNQSQHNLAINLMSAQFRLLRAAISESPNV
ncbi:flagellar basal body rod protein FlgB [Pseudobythopirellula maris]|uniref:Flagellar basal body rod protein FlgB n=1 Tax=Pseudobythopirellula maris TaxID=2527991 RepID=A0A5C5ZH29_9BACT|nr:flagellar basal body rod protein FlgB [Pseudobythopirellula maris]